MAVDLDKIENAAKAAKPELDWNVETYLPRVVYRSDRQHGLVQCYAETAAFVSAVTPAVVLSLVERLKAAERVASAASSHDYNEEEYLAALDAWDAARR